MLISDGPPKELECEVALVFVNLGDCHEFIFLGVVQVFVRSSGGVVDEVTEKTRPVGYKIEIFLA